HAPETAHGEDRGLEAFGVRTLERTAVDVVDLVGPHRLVPPRQGGSGGDRLGGSGDRHGGAPVAGRARRGRSNGPESIWAFIRRLPRGSACSISLASRRIDLRRGAKAFGRCRGNGQVAEWSIAHAWKACV